MKNRNNSTLNNCTQSPIIIHQPQNLEIKRRNKNQKQKQVKKLLLRRCFIFCHLICLHDGDVVYSVFPLYLYLQKLYFKKE